MGSQWVQPLVLLRGHSREEFANNLPKLSPVKAHWGSAGPLVAPKWSSSSCTSKCPRTWLKRERQAAETKSDNCLISSSLGAASAEKSAVEKEGGTGVSRIICHLSAIQVQRALVATSDFSCFARWPTLLICLPHSSLTQREFLSLLIHLLPHCWLSWAT